MAALTLTVDSYRDKLLGGWLGKSAGVTLGAAQRGQLTPGRVNFYQPVPGQPVASVALDFPLVWLSVLEESGAEVQPEDLAVAWLEHLDYSEDEFGYAALNLRRGLPPPASGAHANWFRHATAGVMRADFWAMVAPGAPQVAAAYAYHDANIDHCEEGVWAAMFLAALGSASFFLTDPLLLLTIGLAMIPRNCRTARGVKAALAAAQRGASWLEARESVQKESGHTNFSDAPQNMGFLTIGLLYGSGDFGATLCAGVNCGYDAEAVGGALGAVLGFRFGAALLPVDWTRPMGDSVIPGRGVRDFDVPPTLTEVAERALEIGMRFAAARCPDVQIVLRPPKPVDFLEILPPTAPPPAPPPLAETPEPSAPDTLDNASAFLPPLEIPPSPETPAPPMLEPPLPASDAPQDTPQTLGIVTPQAVGPQPASTPPEISPDAVPASPAAPDLVNAIAWADSTLVKPLLIIPPNALVGQTGPFEVVLDTGDSPAIGFGQVKTLSVSVVNRGETPFTGRIALLAPSGWQIQEPPGLGMRQMLAARAGTFRADYTVRVTEGQGRIDIANAITLRFAPKSGSPQDAEFLLLGASCWWTVGPFANFDGEGFDRSYLPEDRPGLQESYVSRASQSVRWEKRVFPEWTLNLEPLFKLSSGVLYGQTILRSPTTCEARLVANTNSGVKVWLNGALALRRFHKETFRPQIGSGPWAVDVTLNAGDNPVMVKWVRGNEPFEFSLTVSDRYGRGLPEVGNTSW